MRAVFSQFEWSERFIPGRPMAVAVGHLQLALANVVRAATFLREVHLQPGKRKEMVGEWRAKVIAGPPSCRRRALTMDRVLVSSLASRTGVSWAAPLCLRLRLPSRIFTDTSMGIPCSLSLMFSCAAQCQCTAGGTCASKTKETELKERLPVWRAAASGTFHPPGRRW